MAYAFPTDGGEWIGEYGRSLGENADYDAAGSGWGIGFDDNCTDAYAVADPDAEAYSFTFRGPYGNWKKLFTGELGPVDSMMSGAFDVEGDVQKVLQYSDAAVEMTETGRQMDTEFEY